MFSFNVDLGQLIIVGAISVIGWFVKRTITSFEDKLTDHDDALRELSESVNQLIGAARAARVWIRDDPR